MKTLRKYRPGWILIFSLTIFISDCTPKVESEEETSKAKTPVTITSVTQGTLSDSISLNATSSFLKKNSLRSDALGYIDSVEVKIGQYVEKGQTLFDLKTKESTVVHSKSLDSILNFNGKFKIKASTAGIITEVDKQVGDYVTDGEQLCVVAQKGSLVFLMNVPFALNKYVHLGALCSIILPGNNDIRGNVESRLSTVDVASQTQTWVVKAITEENLPENLVVQVKVEKGGKHKAVTLPKIAVLADETEEHFWVMKMINDSIAIKVPVTKGTESESRVEIISPSFSPTDKILLTGNYGLPDTATVQVEKPNTNE